MKSISHTLAITTVTLSLFLLAVPSGQAGTIEGKVKVRGLRSPEGVMVYVSKAPQADGDFSKGRFVMDQKNLTFLPHVLPVPVGSTVEFPNNDKVDHNVFSLSRTKKFNLGTYSPNESKTVTFDEPGIVELRCDVHAEMIAYIMVMKSPYVAVTDSKGRFSIPDRKWAQAAGLPAIPELSAGNYTVKLWHEKLRPVKKKVSVSDAGVVNLELEAGRGPAGSVLYK